MSDRSALTDRPEFNTDEATVSDAGLGGETGSQAAEPEQVANDSSGAGPTDAGPVYDIAIVSERERVWMRRTADSPQLNTLVLRFLGALPVPPYPAWSVYRFRVTVVNACIGATFRLMYTGE